VRLHAYHPSRFTLLWCMLYSFVCLLNWISDWFSALLFVTNGVCAWYIYCKANFESTLLQLVAFIFQFPFYGDFEAAALVYVLRFLLRKGWKEIVLLSLWFLCFQGQSVQENNQIISCILIYLHAWQECISLAYLL